MKQIDSTQNQFTNSELEQIEEMEKDLIEIFDEEYSKRNLITAQNTAEKLAEKGYRKQSDVAREIFGEIDVLVDDWKHSRIQSIQFIAELSELKNKYTEVEK